MIAAPSEPHPDLRTRVATVVAATIAPAAATIDATGAFPAEGIGALARAGALGLLSSPEVGGAR
ncbi:hypothetical protein A7K94_0208980, partial [Modestobacter sp. VKM Ac-2676]